MHVFPQYIYPENIRCVGRTYVDFRPRALINFQLPELKNSLDYLSEISLRPKVPAQKSLRR